MQKLICLLKVIISKTLRWVLWTVLTIALTLEEPCGQKLSLQHLKEATGDHSGSPKEAGWVWESDSARCWESPENVSARNCLSRSKNVILLSSPYRIYNTALLLIAVISVYYWILISIPHSSSEHNFFIYLVSSECWLPLCGQRSTARAGEH